MDLFKYSLQQLQKSGKVDSKVIRPGILAITESGNMGEVIKVTRNNIYLYSPQIGVQSFTVDYIDPLTSERFIEEKQKLEKFYMENKLLNTSQKRLEYVRRRLERLVPKVFPEDRFDIQIHPSYLNLILYYPTLDITNSAGQIHTITDFYFMLKIDSNMRLYDVYTARASFSEKDVFNRNGGSFQVYNHSHSGNRNVGYWGSGFCFGGGTLIGRTVESLYNKIDFRTFTTFLVNLDDILHWESIEGGPFYRISDLVSTSGGNSVVHGITMPDNICDRVYSKVLRGFRDIKKYPSFELRDNNLFIPYKEALHKFVTDIYVEETGDSRRLYLYDPIQNVSYSTRQTNKQQFIMNQLRATSQIKFKGETVPITFIESDTSEEEEPQEKLLHITSYNQIMNKLASELEDLLIKNLKE